MKTPEIRYEHALGDGQWWGKKPPSVPGHLSQPVGGWGGEREKGEEGRERVVEVGEKGREGNGGREEGWKKEMGNKVEEEKAAFVHDYVMKQQRSSSGKTWSTFFFFFRNCSWSCQVFFFLLFFYLNDCFCVQLLEFLEPFVQFFKSGFVSVLCISPPEFSLPHACVSSSVILCCVVTPDFSSTFLESFLYFKLEYLELLCFFPTISWILHCISAYFPSSSFSSFLLFSWASWFFPWLHYKKVFLFSKSWRISWIALCISSCCSFSLSILGFLASVSSNITCSAWCFLSTSWSLLCISVCIASCCCFA